LSGGPWYVIKKDVDANVVYASKGFNVETQYGNEFSMRDFHFITEDCWQDASESVDITFKIRHTPDFTKGQIIKSHEGYRLISEMKLQGIAPGQFGVVYDAASKIFKYGTDGVNSFAEGDEQVAMLMGLKRFTKVAPVNVMEARRRIADKIIEENKYPF